MATAPAPSSTVNPTKFRLNAELAPDVAEALRQYAAENQVSITEAVRRAISTEVFLDKKRTQGAKVLIDENGKLKELVFVK